MSFLRRGKSQTDCAASPAPFLCRAPIINQCNRPWRTYSHIKRLKLFPQIPRTLNLSLRTHLDYSRIPLWPRWLRNTWPRSFHPVASRQRITSSKHYVLPRRSQFNHRYRTHCYKIWSLHPISSNTVFLFIKIPPKRKALAENPTKANSTRRNTKALKTSAKSTAPKSSTTEPPPKVSAKKSKSQTFKYCNANTVHHYLPSPFNPNLRILHHSTQTPS